MADRLPYPYQRDPKDTHPDPPEYLPRLKPDEQNPHQSQKDEPGPGGTKQPMLRQADVPETGKNQYGLMPRADGGWMVLHSPVGSDTWSHSMGDFWNLRDALDKVQQFRQWFGKE